MPDPHNPEPRGRVEGQLFGGDGRFLAHVGLCDTVRTRTKGLLGVPAMSTDECVLLVPCKSVHTHGMKMTIDVACLDRDLRVLALRPELAPRKMLITRRLLRTHAILEAAAG